MIRLAKALTVKLWQLSLLLVILTGILIGVARIVVPELSTYRAQAIQWAEETLGHPVKISDMTIHWRGFGPQLILQDVAFLSTGNREPTFEFDEIRIDFGLVDALLTGTATPRNITIVGAALDVTRNPDGSMVVASLETTPTDSEKDETPLILPWRVSLLDSEVRWEDQLLKIPPQRFHIAKAQFAHDGERHQVNIDLMLPEDSGKVQLAADITGVLHNPNSWAAQFYIASDHLLLPTLTKEFQPSDYLLQQGTADLKLWGRWQAGEIDQIQGQFGLKDLQLSHSQEQEQTNPQLLNVEYLASHFKWQKQSEGWRFDAANIEFQRTNQALQKSNLSIVSQDTHLQLDADALELADILAIAATLPLPDDISNALNKLQPQALITELRINYEDATDTPKWRASGQLNNLQYLAWNSIPGVKNLSGQIEANPKGGALLLNSELVAIDFNGLFRAPLHLQTVSGLLQWEQLPDTGWRIHSNELIAQNSDLETRTRLLMDIPNAPDQSPFLDLQTDYANGTVSSVHHYLPTGIMNDGVVEWLDRALVSGHLTSGSCVVRGHLSDFPFDNYKGRFEVLFGVEDLVLDYFPGWPRLEEVSTEVRFLDNSFDAWIVDGKLLNSEIQQAHGWIDQLSESTPFKLTGEVHGTLNDNLRLLRESPLAEDFAATVSGMRAEGEAEVEIDLAIPLAEIDPPPFRIDGQVGFQDSTLHLDDWQLSLTKMRGDLLFNQDGIRAKGIQAQTLNTAVHVDMGISPAMPNATRVTAKAHVATATLANRFSDIGLERLGGATDWMLQLDIPNKVTQSDAAALISAESELIGIAVDLPAPLGKKASEPRHFQLSTKMGKQLQQPLQGRYGDLLGFSLLLDANNALQRGELRLGGGQAQLPKSEGLHLHARLNEFDITPWLGRAKKLDASGTAGKSPFSAIDIDIKQLHKDELTVNNVAAKLAHKDGGWSGRIATNLFDGNIVIPADIKQETIRLDLDKIELTYKPEEGEKTEEKPAEADAELKAFLDPHDFPAVYLQSDQLILNQQNLGSLEMDIRKIDEGLSLTSTLIKPDQLSLNLSGRWIKVSQKPESWFEFDLNASEVGNLLADMDITHNLKDANAAIKGNLNWVGGPHRISMQGIKGKINADIGKGSILEVDPGIGRILGLLNLTALQRRLSLDFSDLYGKGFGFDRMQGAFKFKDGNADTEGFQIDGPAAKIIVSGRSGLVTHELDQHITVTPQITSSVTLATTIANPAAGAALFLAQKIMGEELDKITRYEYQVTGTWDEPLFSKKKSTFLAPLGKALSTEGQPDSTVDPDEF